MLPLKGWSIEEGMMFKGATPVRIMNVKAIFDTSLIDQLEERNPSDWERPEKLMCLTYENLVILFGAKGIEVRSGSRGFIEGEEGRELLIVLTIEEGAEETLSLLLGRIKDERV